MGWETIDAGDLRGSAAELHRGVLQVVKYAYEHVLKQQPASATCIDDLYGEFSICYATDNTHFTPYINVVSGAACGAFTDHDMSINARLRTVKVDGEYKPLEGTAEHVSTLDELCTWVKTQAQARAAQAAARAEARRRQEEERQRLEADPVWQEQQREAARQRQQAEEEAEQTKRAEWEAKATLLAAKVQSGPGTSAPGSSAAKQEQQEVQAASVSEQAMRPSKLAIQLASCQNCGDHLQFCSDKGCTILLQGSCECRGFSMHANLTGEMYEETGNWKACKHCDKKFCSYHDKMDYCADDSCEYGPYCLDCDGTEYCERCGKVYCKGCWDDEEGCVCQFSLFDWSDPDPTPLECGTDPFMGYLRDPDSPPRSPSVAPRYPTFVINAIDGAVNVVQGPNGSQRSF